MAHDTPPHTLLTSTFPLRLSTLLFYWTERAQQDTPSGVIFTSVYDWIHPASHVCYNMILD